MIIKEKSFYTVTEFAKLMNVGYNTVKGWLKRDIVPGAYKKNGRGVTLDRWCIPHEALKMQKPHTGRRPGDKHGPYRTRKSEEIKQLRTELADLNKRHIELMEKHAGLQGKYERLEQEKLQVELSKHAK